MEDDWKERAKREAREAEEAFRREREALPGETTFIQFVEGLAAGALVALGEAENPVDGRKRSDPAQAKQIIDILGMLQEKTKGNLNDEEEAFLKGLLTELRLKFVRLWENVSKGGTK